jgi:hypothetical protein
MIKSNDKKGIEELLKNTEFKSKDLLYVTEYRAMYEGDKLFNRDIK